MVGAGRSQRGGWPPARGGCMSRHIDVGLAPGQPELTAGGEGVAMASPARVLPARERAAQRTRSMWRHPASMASLALLVVPPPDAPALLVLTTLTRGSDTVNEAWVEIWGGD